MPHKFLSPTVGFSGGFTLFSGLLAQAGDSVERWGSMGAAVVISCLLAYIITQRDPKAQEKVAELIKHITEKHTMAMEATVKHITEKSMAAIEKIQQENAIATQGIVKDHKELMESTIKLMVEEKVNQRKDLIEHFNGVFDVIRGREKKPGKPGETNS